MKSFDIITEADARTLEVGSSVTLKPGGHVTPLAADTLKARRITVMSGVAEASLDYLYIRRSPKLEAPVTQVASIHAEVPPRQMPTVGAYDGTMPDLRGLSLRSAVRALDGSGCNLKIEGQGFVVAQQPSPGAALDRMASVSLTLDAAEAN